jgi:site-specific recombinase XerD
MKVARRRRRSDDDEHDHPTLPGRARRIPLTNRLAKALKIHAHLRGARVVCHENGTALTQKAVQGIVRKAASKARLAESGVHMLRHTSCSPLAIREASTRAIQQLDGHKDLGTTQMYMQLTPAALEEPDSFSRR